MRTRGFSVTTRFELAVCPVKRIACSPMSERDAPSERDQGRSERFFWSPGDLEEIPGPAHLDPDPDLEIPREVFEAKELANRRSTIEHLKGAYTEFMDGYRAWGGYRYHGFTSQADPENFRGPVILSESDIVIRLGAMLAGRFPETSEVHAEFNIATWTRADYDKAEDRAQRIDLAVSDLSCIEQGPEAQEQFRNLVHWLFVEVKWVPKGWWGGPWEKLEAMKRVEAISRDAWRLSRHLELDRCLLAAVFVVDDECLFDYLHGQFEWPLDVPVLRVSPSALAAVGFEDDELVAASLERAYELSLAGEFELPPGWPAYVGPGGLVDP